MKLIEKIKLTSTSDSVVFNLIPQTYTDLKIFISARSSDENDECLVLPNGTNANLSYLLSRVYGNNLNSASVLRLYIPRNSFTANTFGNASVMFTNYANLRPKPISFDSVGEYDGSSDGSLAFNTGLWNDSSPITSLTLKVNNSTTGFAANSAFYLYGISAGSDGSTTVS